SHRLALLDPRTRRHPEVAEPRVFGSDPVKRAEHDDRLHRLRVAGEDLEVPHDVAKAAKVHLEGFIIEQPLAAGFRQDRRDAPLRGGGVRSARDTAANDIFYAVDTREMA